jgi:hypothetical protein
VTEKGKGWGGGAQFFHLTYLPLVDLVKDYIAHNLQQMIEFHYFFQAGSCAT